MWRDVVRSGVLLAACTALVACSDRFSPLSPHNRAPVSLDLGAAMLPCAVYKLMPSPVQTYTYFGSTMSGSACGVSWNLAVPSFSVPGIQTGFVFRSFAAGGTASGAPIYTLATSYNNGEPQGSYQLGPMVVAFGQSVDRFVMEFDHGCVAAGQCGTGFRRIVVENDSGRVLLDTLADKLAIL